MGHGLEKKGGSREAAKAFGVDVQRQAHDQNSLYVIRRAFLLCVYVDIALLPQIGQYHRGRPWVVQPRSTCGAHDFSSSPFAKPYRVGEIRRERITSFAELEQGILSGYSTAVGLSARERAARETWVKVERERRDRITLKPRQIKRIVALVSGGDFAGAGAALKELRVTGHRFGLEVYFARHGFLGLANNWIEAVTEDIPLHEPATSDWISRSKISRTSRCSSHHALLALYGRWRPWWFWWVRSLRARGARRSIWGPGR